MKLFRWEMRSFKGSVSHGSKNFEIREERFCLSLMMLIPSQWSATEHFCLKMGKSSRRVRLDQSQIGTWNCCSDRTAECVSLTKILNQYARTFQARQVSQ